MTNKKTAVGRALAADWFLNSFIMIVYEEELKLYNLCRLRARELIIDGIIESVVCLLHCPISINSLKSN